MPFELPSSLAWLLSLFRGCFTQPTFQTFCALAVGTLTRVRGRTVTGMLAASGFACEWHHSRAHRFFSRARWVVDELGFACLELISDRFVAEGEPLVVAIDDTLLERYGPKVFGPCLNYDGNSLVQRASRTAFGNSWVVAGVVVELPFLGRSVCLPVLFRLWRPRQGPTQVELGCELARLVAQRRPECRLIVLADGAYAGSALAPGKLPDNVALLCRARRDLRLYAPAPGRRAGRMGRPAKNGKRLDSLRELAAGGAPWRRCELTLYGERETVKLIEQRGIWYPVWGQAPVKAVAVRDAAAPDQLEAVLITSDPKLCAKRIVELYSRRWAIEVAFRDAKQLVGVGEAENRTRLAVERTAPFAFLCLTLAIAWYALFGHSPEDVAEHRRRRPWYRTKTEPSVEDMLAKLRRTVIAARLSPATGRGASAEKLAGFAEAWEMAAA